MGLARSADNKFVYVCIKTVLVTPVGWLREMGRKTHLGPRFLLPHPSLQYFRRYLNGKCHRQIRGSEVCGYNVAVNICIDRRLIGAGQHMKIKEKIGKARSFPNRIGLNRLTSRTENRPWVYTQPITWAHAHPGTISWACAQTSEVQLCA